MKRMRLIIGVFILYLILFAGCSVKSNGESNKALVHNVKNNTNSYSPLTFKWSRGSFLRWRLEHNNSPQVYSGQEGR